MLAVIPSFASFAIAGCIRDAVVLEQTENVQITQQTQQMNV